MKIKSTIDVGCMIRGQFRRLLEKEKFRRESLTIRYREQKGFCESTFLLEVEGPYAEEWYETLKKVT